MWASHSPSAFSASDVSLEDDLITSPSLHTSVNSSPEQYTDHTFTHTIAYWSPDPLMEETLQPVCPVTIESFQLSGRLHNSDGTPPPPPRKRRRPALSCEQCRKRKIKCDRNYPCTQCLQSKTAECSYSADSPVRATGHVSTSTGFSSIQNGISMPNRARNAPSAPSSTKLSSDGTSPTAMASSGSTQISSWGSPTAEAHMDETSSPKALVDRVQKLESIFLADNGNRSMESNIFFPKLESSRELRLRGTYSKTRFFGQSHWMYSFGMVLASTPLAAIP
jgi:Fungal Zn(2)-Cys(6) binuclear cluster domain